MSLVRSDESLKKERKAYEEMAKLKNEAEELKVELLRKETDISALLTRNRALETQLQQLRQERDRLLEVSSDLKIQLHQTESKQLRLNQKSTVTSESRMKSPPPLASTQQRMHWTNEQQKTSKVIDHQISYGDADR